MTWKKFRNEAILFLVCLVVSIVLILPLLMLFSNSTAKPFVYKDVVGNFLRLLIFPDELKKDMGAWAVAISPWLVIQSGRFLIWSLSRLGQAFRGHGFATGLVVGICLIGGMWWWTQKSDVETDDPYYSVKGTSPEYWHHSNRDETWKSGDMKDCHQFVDHYWKSKQYLPWERRLNEFENCMKEKGYHFKDLSNEKQ